MGDTIWTNRNPGEFASVMSEGQGVEGVVFPRFIDSDAMEINPETPAFDGNGLHPMAGRKVRVTMSFRSIDPTGRCEGDQWAHLWCEHDGVDFGVAETPLGFVGYQASTFPDRYPKSEVRRRG